MRGFRGRDEGAALQGGLLDDRFVGPRLEDLGQIGACSASTGGGAKGPVEAWLCCSHQLAFGQEQPARQRCLNR
jgi:hypothetical protein